MARSAGEWQAGTFRRTETHRHPHTRRRDRDHPRHGRPYANPQRCGCHDTTPGPERTAAMIHPPASVRVYLCLSPCDGRPARLTVADLPGPEQTKAFPVPADDGRGFDDEDAGLPVVPDGAQPDPQPPIRRLTPYLTQPPASSTACNPVGAEAAAAWLPTPERFGNNAETWAKRGSERITHKQEPGPGAVTVALRSLFADENEAAREAEAPRSRG